MRSGQGDRHEGWAGNCGRRLLFACSKRGERWGVQGQPSRPTFLAAQLACTLPQDPTRPSLHARHPSGSPLHVPHAPPCAGIEWIPETYVAMMHAALSCNGKAGPDLVGALELWVAQQDAGASPQLGFTFLAKELFRLRYSALAMQVGSRGVGGAEGVVTRGAGGARRSGADWGPWDYEVKGRRVSGFGLAVCAVRKRPKWTVGREVLAAWSDVVARRAGDPAWPCEDRPFPCFSIPCPVIAILLYTYPRSYCTDAKPHPHRPLTPSGCVRGLRRRAAA